MRYIIRKFVEAPDTATALKKEKRSKVFEIYLDNEVWKERGFSLKDDLNNKIGFKDNGRNADREKSSRAAG